VCTSLCSIRSRHMPSMWGVLPPTPVAPARRGLPSISRTTCVPASKRQHPITRPHARARKHISTVFIERAAALTIARRVLSLSRSRYTAEFDRPGVCQRPICAVCRPVTAAPILAQPHDNVGCTTISIGVAKLARGSGLGVRDTRGRGLTHPQVGVYAVCHEAGGVSRRPGHRRRVSSARSHSPKRAACMCIVWLSVQLLTCAHTRAAGMSVVAA